MDAYAIPNVIVTYILTAYHHHICEAAVHQASYCVVGPVVDAVILLAVYLLAMEARQGMLEPMILGRIYVSAGCRHLKLSQSFVMQL